MWDPDEDSASSEGRLEDQDPLLPQQRPLADPLPALDDDMGAGLLGLNGEMDGVFLELDGDMEAGLPGLDHIQPNLQEAVPDWDVTSSQSTQLAVPSALEIPSVSFSGGSSISTSTQPLLPVYNKSRKPDSW